MKLILASKSQTRKDFLDKLGIPYECKPADINEKAIRETDPKELVKAIALAKAKRIAINRKNSIILGMDTVMYFQNQIHEKPETKQEAYDLLKSLSRSKFDIWSGIALINTENPEDNLESAVATQFIFGRILKRDLDTYVESGEPLNYAGGISPNCDFFIRHCFGR